MIDLRKGDCLELMKDLPDKSIDAIITDPPYGTTTCKWDSVIPFDKMWKQLNRIIKPNGAILLFGQEPFSSFLRCSNINNYRYDWIWDKVSTTNFANAKKMPLSCYEVISVFYKSLPTYNPQMTDAKSDRIRPISKPKENTSETNKQASGKTRQYSENYDNTKRFPRKIIEVSCRLAECNSLNRVHPTQKPELLMEYLIKTYTNDNEVVLDFTMGSGTTGVACVNTNRNFIGMELDDKYFEIAKERIEKAIAEKERMLFKDI
jgi:site-specific DNA-methyltransferase (adenine-specific)